MNEGRWHIGLFGGLRVAPGRGRTLDENHDEREERVITRFSTQKTGALLAYLAYFRERSHPREVLIEMLWPGDNLQAGRHSLSMALSSLRHQLEPPGVPSGAVIVADRQNVGLNRDAVVSDVALFEAALQTAARTAAGREKALRLAEAVALYTGPLLPGYYEEWTLTEQGRLEARFVETTLQLAHLWEGEGDWAQAVAAAQQAASAEPLGEEAQRVLLRLLLKANRAGEALRRYNEFAQRLEDETGSAPGADLRNLLRRIETERQKPGQAEDGEPSRDAKPLPVAPPPPQSVPVAAAAPLIPTGTVTFLVADMEATNGKSEDESGVSAAYDLLRGAARKHGGYEVDKPNDKSRTLAVAFAAAGDALRAAVAGQQDAQAASSDFQARIALHTGDVVAEGEAASPVGADALGASEPARRAVRLLEACQGGQIFVSETTIALLRPPSLQALPGARFTDLGLFRLGGDGESATRTPERIFRVEPPGFVPAPDAAPLPPPRAQPAHQANLPLTFTRFFGREREIAQLTELLQEPHVRLVTLTGPGGTGKTRLSLQVAERLVEPFGGMVCFAPLAEISNANGIAEAIVAALRLPPDPHKTPLARIAAHLNNKRALLVLDNFEQIAVDGAPVVQELLQSVPTLACLVTSRQLLNLEAEREFAVGPLPTPSSAIHRPEQLRLFEAAQVFVDRAQAVRPDFQITPHNAPAIAALCERLEGLPLALELAASRAQVLSPAQMLSQLDNRFDFLVSRRADKAVRHRSLFAAIEWSFRLLDPLLAAFFVQLSVFRGGWTLEMAEAVCEQPLALDYLAQLRECSLILSEETETGEIRFRMLESLREFAWAQASPDEKASLLARHRDAFLQWAEDGRAHLATKEQSRWLDCLQTEHSNLRAALDYDGSGPDADDKMLRLAAALTQFWLYRGLLREGEQYLTDALARTKGDEGDPARLENRALAFSGAGEIAWVRGDVEKSRALLEESVALRRLLGEPKGIATALNNLGNMASGQDDFPAARALYEESLSLHRAMGHTLGIARTLNNLGSLIARMGDNETSHALLEESLQLRREVGDPRGIAIALCNLGNIECDLGQTDAARARYAECLRLCRDLGEKNGVAYALDGFADVARASGSPTDAARFYGAADALREAAEIRLPAPERARRETGIAAARQSATEPNAFAVSYAEGQAMGWEDACALVLGGA